MRRLFIQLFLTAFVMGMDAAWAETSDFSADAAAYLSSVDFSSAINGRTCLDPTSEAAEAIGLDDLALTVASLDPADVKYVGVYSLPSGAWHTYHWTITRCLHFQLEHGRLPAGGYEFFPELATPQGLEQFKAMSPSERVIRYSDGIDFATGKFCCRFDDPAWRPGGLYLRVLTEVVEELPGGRGFHDHSFLMKPGTVACEYKVYGCQPDSILANSYAASADRVIPEWQE
jgi:hypothetical protein